MQLPVLLPAITLKTLPGICLASKLCASGSRATWLLVPSKSVLFFQCFGSRFDSFGMHCQVGELVAANSGSGPAAAKQPEVWLLVLSKSVLFKNCLALGSCIARWVKLWQQTLRAGQLQQSNRIRRFGCWFSLNLFCF